MFATDARGGRSGAIDGRGRRPGGILVSLRSVAKSPLDPGDGTPPGSGGAPVSRPAKTPPPMYMSCAMRSPLPPPLPTRTNYPFLSCWSRRSSATLSHGPSMEASARIHRSNASRGRGIEEGGKGGCQEGSRMAADGPELPQRGAVPATGAIPELQAQLGQGKGRCDALSSYGCDNIWQGPESSLIFVCVRHNVSCVVRGCIRCWRPAGIHAMLSNSAQKLDDARRARAGVCKGGHAAASAPPSRGTPGLRTAAAARSVRRATARAATARAARCARGGCAYNEPQRSAGACESRSAQILHPKP